MGKVLLGAIASLVMTAPLLADNPAVPDLTGLWTGKLRYGPDIKGPLLIYRDDHGWIADLAGYRIPVTVAASRLSFALPDGRGAFRGVVQSGTLHGQWVQEKTISGGSAYATPIALKRDPFGRWAGTVDPVPDTITYFLPLTRSGNSYSTFLANPERNVGRFIPIRRLQVIGDQVKIFGSRGKGPEQALGSGSYGPGSFTLALRGSSVDFSLDTSSSSPFYTRGKPPERYSYHVPLAIADGWPVSSLQSVGISTSLIERFIQKLIDSRPAPGVPQIHSVLIARHGKLVLEEYFHGFSRNTTHDIRSAGKSMTAMMIGSAMLAGMPVREDAPVYATMIGAVPAGLDPRKRSMTLKHLMTMSSGYYCDDSNSDAPGNEDNLPSQTAAPDLYSYILNLPMASAPGEKAVYCSANALLAGGMLSKMTGEPLPELFERLIARPLQMDTYHLNLTGSGELYTAGGASFLPRDYMKLAQVMLDRGTWHGRRIISADWAAKSAAPLYDLSPQQQYGYFWNSSVYDWKGRKVRAVFAAGNGTQIFLEIPELDLVIVFNGGNYSDASALIAQRVMVPQDILPAVN